MAYTVPLKPLNPRINWSNPLTRGLIFDSPNWEGGGSTTKDLAELDTGTFSGSTLPAWKYNIAGRGLLFDGANSYIDFTESTFLDIAVSKISLQCLFICTNTGSGGDMINKPVSSTIHTSPFFSYSMHLTNLGIRTWLTTVGNSGGVSTGEVAVTQGALVNGISTYDGGTIRQFVNGAQVASTGTSGNIVSSATPLRIGANGGKGEVFPGTIFVSRVWNRTLIQSEITQLTTNPWRIYQQPRALTPGYSALPMTF